MKKALAFGIASICAMGFAGSVFAAETPTTIEALYDVDESYTVTFPAVIEFEDYNDEQIVTVEADDVLLNDGSKLKITMISTNGALKNGTSSIAYTIANGENEPEDIVASTPFDILTIESGDRDGDTATLTFTSGDDTDVTIAGKHSDTLTFKVEIDDGIAFMQDIDATMKAKIASGEIAVLKDKRDNKKYSVAKIGNKYWMTSDLKNTDNDDGTSWNDGILAAGGKVYYNWNAAKTACPSGWTLPSKTDFENLISAASLTEDNISSSPFYAVRAGYANNDGDIFSVGYFGLYWSSTGKDDDLAYYLYFDDSGMGVYGGDKTDGYSVRCVVAEQHQE